MYRSLDQTHRIVLRLFDHLFQDQLLVSGLDLGEVALDAAELRKVRHVEDLRDIQCLKEQLRILGLVDGQVVEEEREVTTPELLGELANEGDEEVGVDRSGLDCEVDEAAVLTDGRDERQRLTFKSESLTLILSLL